MSFTVTETGPEQEGEGVALEDFVAIGPDHTYMFLPCRTTWAKATIDARLPRIAVIDKQGRPKQDAKGKAVSILPTTWLDRHNHVDLLTWAPGLPLFIRDKIVVAGGWIDRKGMRLLNLYRPPRLKIGDASQAAPWLNHVKAIYPDDAEHIVQWLAHHAQCPGNKVNHALVLGGEPNIGKDSILAPMKDIVGYENFHDIRPTDLLGRFNGFVKAVLLRINEAHDLGEIDRFKFYDRTKIYTAAPPEVLRVDEKHLREYYVTNCMGVIITTNHKSDGLHLLPNDRRHYVAWSQCTTEDFSPEYFNKLHTWYEGGGVGHVAAYLLELDLGGFDPKAPPLKTPAFWEIVSANTAPEDAELIDAIEAIGGPDGVTAEKLIEGAIAANSGATDWLMDRRNRRSMPHRMERCGYVPVRNPEAKDGLWKISGKRSVVYAKSSLTPRDRVTAARRMMHGK
jgi:hypothetical protein